MPKGRTTKVQALKSCAKSGRKIIWSDEKDHWHCATDINNTPHWSKEVFDVATGARYVHRDGQWSLQ